jgi:flavin reductase (DIM6/NTAB) family NADH-FMN oxidoreductase RutF
MAKKTLEASPLLFPVMTALVSCQGTTGGANIITVSWGGILRTYPPVVGISVQKTHFSHRLIMETKEYVLNLPTEDILWKVDYCGWVSGSEEDKFTMTGLTPIPSRIVKAPAIRECPVNLECKVREIIDLEPYHLFIADVVATVADEEVILPGGDEADGIAFKEVLDVINCKPISYIPGSGKYWKFSKELKPIFFSKEKKST